MNKTLTVTELQKKLDALEQNNQIVVQELKWMKLVLKMVGVDGVWVSPEVAATAVGRSRDRVMGDIETAERWRHVKGKNWNLVYGVHYRNDQRQDSKQASWKVNLTEYYEFTKIPPDQLKAW